MKALTVHQPWAQLIAIGVKRIETRSRRAPVALIGERIAIHAGVSIGGILALPGDCDGNYEDGWRYGYVGDWQASVCVRTGDTGRRGDGDLVDLDGVVVPLAFGAVVCTARLVACAPIGGPYSFRTSNWDGNPQELQDEWVIVHHPPLSDWLPESLILCPPDKDGSDITDQLPLGDFTPGRWGWMLDDVEPVNPPAPARGQQGLWDWTPSEEES